MTVTFVKGWKLNTAHKKEMSVQSSGTKREAFREKRPLKEIDCVCALNLSVAHGSV